MRTWNGTHKICHILLPRKYQVWLACHEKVTREMWCRSAHELYVCYNRKGRLRCVALEVEVKMWPKCRHYWALQNVEIENFCLENYKLAKVIAWGGAWERSITLLGPRWKFQGNNILYFTDPINEYWKCNSSMPSIYKYIYITPKKDELFIILTMNQLFCCNSIYYNILGIYVWYPLNK